MNQEAWEKAVAFHGHTCPGLAIGTMAALAAKEQMGIENAVDEEIVCVTENDACGVDAVQAILSCTFGKGNLLYHNSGKMAFSFFKRENGQKLRFYYKARKKEGMSRQEYIDYLLNADFTELFTISEPRYDLPEKARLFDTVTCAICGEGAPEHKIRLQEGQTVCLDCFKVYDRGWR